jgi:hypothetical protein
MLLVGIGVTSLDLMSVLICKKVLRFLNNFSQMFS